MGYTYICFVKMMLAATTTDTVQYIGTQTQVKITNLWLICCRPTLDCNSVCHHPIPDNLQSAACCVVKCVVHLCFPTYSKVLIMCISFLEEIQRQNSNYTVLFPVVDIYCCFFSIFFLALIIKTLEMLSYCYTTSIVIILFGFPCNVYMYMCSHVCLSFVSEFICTVTRVSV